MQDQMHEFEGVGAYAEFAIAGPSDGYSRVDTEDRVKFSGGTWAEAVSQAQIGNPELVQEIAFGTSKISEMLHADSLGWMRDVTGDFFDVADYLSGEPEVFRRQEFVEQKPVIPVYASFSMSCNISNKIIKNRGCAIVALCDELQKAGYIVDLRLVHCVVYAGKRRVTNIKIANDPFDLDAVAFVLANPLCLRRVYFAFLENVEKDSYCGGYGSPMDINKSDMEFDEGQTGFFFGSSQHCSFSWSNFSSLERAKDHISSMLDEMQNNPGMLIYG